MPHPTAELYRAPLSLLWRNRKRAGFVYAHLTIEGDAVTVRSAWMDGFADPDWLAILAHCETPAMETDVTQLLVEAAPGQSVLIVTHATEEGGLHYVGYVYTHAAIETALRRLKPARRKRKTAKGFGCTKSVAQ